MAFITQVCSYIICLLTFSMYVLCQANINLLSLKKTTDVVAKFSLHV